MNLAEKYGWETPPVPKQQEGEEYGFYMERLWRHFMVHVIFKGILRKRDDSIRESFRGEIRDGILEWKAWLESADTDDIEIAISDILEGLRRHPPKTGRAWPLPAGPGGAPGFWAGLHAAKWPARLHELFERARRGRFWLDALKYGEDLPPKERAARLRYGWVLLEADMEPDWDGVYTADGIRVAGVRDSDFRGDVYAAFEWKMPKRGGCPEHLPVRLFDSEFELDAWFRAGAPLRPPKKRRARAFDEPDRDGIRKGPKANTVGIGEERFFSELAVPSPESSFKKSVPKYAREYFMDLAYDSAGDIMEAAGLSLGDFSLGGSLGLRFSWRSASAHARFVWMQAEGESYPSMLIEMAEDYSASGLAHEWWHAISFAASHFLSEEDEAAKAAAMADGWEGVGPLVSAVLHAPELAAYRSRCARLDKRRRKPYFSKPDEMLARLFEGRVWLALAEEGAFNAHLLSPGGLAAWSGKKGGHADMPETADIEFMAPLFDSFFRELRERGIMTERTLPELFEADGGQMSFFEF